MKLDEYEKYDALGLAQLVRQREVIPVCTENLNTGVAVMNPAQHGT
jgi:hypothetical protein